MLRSKIQWLCWFVAGAVCVVATAGAVSLSLQIPAGPRATLTVPLPPNQEVGVVVQDITPAIAASLGLKEQHGAVVTALDAGTLQAGDVIISVNGQNVSSRRNLETVIAGIPPNDTLVFQVSRSGGTHEVVIQRTTTAAAPAEDHPVPKAIAPGFRGVRVENWNGGVTSDSGVVVTQVDRGTPAEAAGLRIGDVIVDLNQTPVQSVAEFLGQMEKLSGQRVMLGVIRQGIYSIVVVPSFY
jgi:S1-C subfamily serine protease